ncbi:MAG TPA: T9SS type A sorting domain-containing protein [Saprospiraceae bacterium]|nr:T9SS type A sorting domain-containing protein [Saprospiraceae bacterium]
MNNPIYALFSRKGEWGIALLCLFSISFAGFGQLSVQPDNLYHRYSAGDTIKYQVLSSTSGDVDFLIKRDPLLPSLAQGKVAVTANQVTEIEYTPTEPGNYFCTVSTATESASTVAVSDRRGLAPIQNAPADFDAYWAGIRAQLDTIPIDAQVVLDTNVNFQSAYSKTYRLSLGSIDGHRAYGYMTVPETSGVFTGLIKFPAFGNSDAAQPDLPMSERLGAIVISLSIHNSPVNVNLPQNQLYVPDITTTDTVYYQWAMAAGMRVIDYLETRADFDGSHVGVYGVSQGAGLAMLLAGVDSRVDLVAVSNPILSQHDGLKYAKPSGFPEYIRNYLNNPTEVDRILNAVKYYDAVFAMQNFHGPFLTATSVKDEVTPSETSYVAYNQMDGKVVHLHNLEGLHADNPPEYWEGKFDMIRRYFPTNYSWPNAQYHVNETGYEADAGNDQTSSGLQAVLSGTIDDNGTTNPANIPVHWELVAGPGTVSFTSPNDYVTTATFSESGLYYLRFVGEEISDLTTESKYTTIEDVVALNICPANNCAPLPIELTDFSARKLESQVDLVWHTASEKNNAGFRVMRSTDAFGWEEIGFVKGSGQSTSLKGYEWIDRSPNTGINYYRLIQLDLDGQEHLSEIKDIVFAKKTKVDPVLYPNPTNKSLQFSGLGEEIFMLNVLDQWGRTVLVSEVQDQEVLDLEKLPPGNYFFRFSDGRKSYFRMVSLVGK